MKWRRLFENFISPPSIQGNVDEPAKEREPYESAWESYEASPERKQHLRTLKRHRDAEAVSAARLAEERARADAALPQGDLYDLHRNKQVRVKAIGDSITTIHVEVQNLTSTGFRVAVAPGIYLIAKGNHQNMVVTTERLFVLQPSSLERFSINAACLDATLAVPGPHDEFEGLARVPDDVASFLEAARNEPEMVIQTGIWAITNAYTAEQVKTSLCRFDYRRIRWSVTDFEVSRAKDILSDLGIPSNL